MRLIDADRLKRDIERQAEEEYFDTEYAEFNFFEIIAMIDSQLTIEPKQGKWIPHQIGREWDVCTNCGISSRTREYGEDENGLKWGMDHNYLYCPHCGARMEIEE